MIGTDSIKKLYEQSPLNDGWYQTVDGFVDMCFSVSDKSPGNKDNEVHCYVTFAEAQADDENNAWSGYFSYWTPDQGMPCDSGTKFKEADLSTMGVPMLLVQQEWAFNKLRLEAMRFIQSCKKIR
jgi:hypothetical protein